MDKVYTLYTDKKGNYIVKFEDDIVFKTDEGMDDRLAGVIIDRKTADLDTKKGTISKAKLKKFVLSWIAGFETPGSSMTMT